MVAPYFPFPQPYSNKLPPFPRTHTRARARASSGKFWRCKTLWNLFSPFLPPSLLPLLLWVCLLLSLFLFWWFYFCPSVGSGPAGGLRIGLCSTRRGASVSLLNTATAARALTALQWLGLEFNPRTPSQPRGRQLEEGIELVM